MSTYLIMAAVFGGLVFLLILTAILFRIVVPTNEVHIVQSSKHTVSYGKDQTSGNTYYSWPSWVPVIGVKTVALPVSVFDVELEGYAAYDKGRLPFQIDIMAFFRVVDSNVAAQRVSTVDELNTQLKGILQGACRTILASSEIENILEGRGEFGEKFTKEVDHQLVQWGVQSVKQIELMDIRDAAGSSVIANIMAKKKSEIEKESRVTVALNHQIAKVAEIEAQQIVGVREQEAEQLVALRKAEKEKTVGTANEVVKQEIKVQQAETMSKDKDIARVEQVRQAEINKEVEIVQAEQQRQTNIIEADASRQTDIIKADGDKQKTILIAEGQLEQSKRDAEGIRVKGEAQGSAEQAILMAPVNTQITLAREIAASKDYQHYLISVRAIEANEQIGIKQAEALRDADVKVIANAGDASTGIKSAADILSSKGGTQIGAMIEGFANTDQGKAIISKLLGNS